MGIDIGRREVRIAALGLLVGVVFGIGGSSVSGVTPQSVLYAISSIGWVIGTAILVAASIKAGHLLAGAGFALLTVAEPLLWVSGRPGGPDYSDGFGGGTMFYVPGLLLLAASVDLGRIPRLLAAVSSLVWAVGASLFLSGRGFADTDPLATAGYVATSAFFVWIAISLLRVQIVGAVRRADRSMEGVAR